VGRLGRCLVHFLHLDKPMSIRFHHDGLCPVKKSFAAQSIEWIVGDLGLKRDVTFWLDGRTNGMKADGTRMPEDQRIHKDPGVNWEDHDGTAWENGIIYILIEPDHGFPYIWSVNPACGEGYVNHTTLIENAEELFIYLAAHELRHLWQWENKRATSTLLRLMKMTDETDADLYAIRMLSAYKSQ